MASLLESTLHPDFSIGHTNLHWDINILANKISESCQPKDNIIFMSNGGFSGLQNKVAQLLKNE